MVLKITFPETVRKYGQYGLFLILLILAGSCTTYQYIYDPASRQRQKDMVAQRSMNTGCNALGCLSSAFITAIWDIETDFIPTESGFKRLKLINPTPDTMFVNMLTNAIWDENQYCDFKDIRIPPGKCCRLLTLLNTDYNLYFGNTDDPHDDELLEINTSSHRRYKLIP